MEFNRSNVANYDYSFSGMKTSFLYAFKSTLRKRDFIEKHKADICANQRALLDVLFDKLEKAIKDTGISNVAWWRYNSIYPKTIKHLRTAIRVYY